MEAEAMTTVGDASDGCSERRFIDNKTNLAMQRQNGRRPTSQSLVVTKSLKAEWLPDPEFERDLLSLERLQRNMYETFGSAVEALVTFAVGYLALYDKVARNRFQVDRLDKSLGLDSFAATRLRTIAAQAPALKSMQEHLLSALEPLYEVTLALKRDESVVRKAIAEKTLPPQSTLKDVRALRQPVNVIGTVLKGQEVRGGPYDSQVSVQGLKNLAFQITFPQDRVLRIDDISAFQQKVEAVLRETFAVRCVEVGVFDDDGDWKGPADLSRYLHTYWKLKDDGEALEHTVEAQAAQAVAARKNLTPIEREQAMREARQESWTPFQAQRKRLEEQFNALFGNVSKDHSYRKAVGEE